MQLLTGKSRVLNNTANKTANRTALLQRICFENSLLGFRHNQ
jgi:hypothetical protein